MAPRSAPPEPFDPLAPLQQHNALPLQSFVTFRINQLSMAFERQWTRYMRDRAGMSLAEWRIVATLASSGEEATFAHVVQATGMNKSLCSRCVTSLRDQGFLSVEPTPGDSRSLTLQLTRKATRLLGELGPVVLQRQRMFLEALTRDERVALFSALDKLQAVAAKWNDRGPEASAKSTEAGPRGPAKAGKAAAEPTDAQPGSPRRARQQR